ncbi:hypothetical protein LXA43DRAFT_1035541 [Ganoderma leucocontextum]|nr:hypothetical protein LXA43DRAFT_1035541 [Ganoderma leucocontextum]
MSTETQQATAAPELTILYRVGSIPLVADSISVVNTTLLNNAYTRSPYTTATEISKRAFSYTEPVQQRLAPIIIRADGLANKGFDLVQQRFPYPFQTPTDVIIKDFKTHSDAAVDVATKTIDERVRTPAYNIAQGIDQKFAPIVDIFAVVVNKVQPNGTPEKPAEVPKDAKFQYQRAYYLSKELSDQLRTYSTEQINLITAQRVIVQSASATAQSVTQLASSSYDAAQVRVHSLSDTMLSELRELRTSILGLPAALQSAFQDVSTNLASTINDLSAILTSSDPLPEKVTKVRDTVTDRVQPILDTANARAQEILAALKARVSENKEAAQATANPTAPNGNGHA